MEGEMWKRQRELGLDVPESVAVIGVGGIGSWVAYFFARLGVKRLIIADADEIELHNLNRTPFRTYQVGMKKVEALAEIIYDFRDDIEIETIDGYITDHDERVESADIVIDTRDNTRILPVRTDFKLNYDGTIVSVYVKPSPDDLDFGEDAGYTTTPSYVVAPVIASAIVTHIVAKMDWRNLKPTVFTFDISKMIDCLMEKRTLM